MKITKKLLAGAMAVAIGGFVMTGMASATTTVTPVEGETVSYTLNGNDSLVFTAGVLEISGDDTKIWILDRNLGATAAGTGCDKNSNGGNYCVGGELDPTYGYHFQWGNNYGFKPCTDSDRCKTFPNNENTGTQLSSLSTTYTPFYTNPVFIVGSKNWYSNNSKVDLWGGSTADNTYSVNDETWKVDLEHVTERRGPCPEGFHVPSIGELDKIMNMMGNNASAIHSQLLVPFAGYRSYSDATVYSLGLDADLRSSSPYYTEPTNSRYLTLNVDGPLGKGHNKRARASSLRCVYDSYETYTPVGNLSSEGGEPQVIVNIGQFNGGQNTCTGSNYIFENIQADKESRNYELTGVFECAFGDSQSKTVTLQLSGNLVADGDRVISGANVQMKNSEWTSSPVGLKFANTMISTYQALTATKTLFQKTGSMIGIASGVVSVQITVPAGTPDGTYNGTLVLTY